MIIYDHMYMSTYLSPDDRYDSFEMIILANIHHLMRDVIICGEGEEGDEL